MKRDSQKNKTEEQPAEKAFKQHKKQSLKEQFSALSSQWQRFEVFTVTLVFIIIVGLFGARMLNLLEPPVNEQAAQESKSKQKVISIDQKAVDRIKTLVDSKTTVSPEVDKTRRNPFE